MAEPIDTTFYSGKLTPEEQARFNDLFTDIAELQFEVGLDGINSDDGFYDIFANGDKIGSQFNVSIDSKDRVLRMEKLQEPITDTYQNGDVVEFTDVVLDDNTQTVQEATVEFVGVKNTNSRSESATTDSTTLNIDPQGASRVENATMKLTGVFDETPRSLNLSGGSDSGSILVGGNGGPADEELVLNGQGSQTDKSKTYTVDGTTSFDFDIGGTVAPINESIEVSEGGNIPYGGNEEYNYNGNSGAYINGVGITQNYLFVVESDSGLNIRAIEIGTGNETLYDTVYWDNDGGSFEGAKASSKHDIGVYHGNVNNESEWAVGAYDLSDGTHLWEDTGTTADGLNDGSELVAISDSSDVVAHVYADNGEQYIKGYDINNGTNLWTIGPKSTNSIPVTDSDNFLLENGEIIDPADGTIIETISTTSTFQAATGSLVFTEGDTGEIEAYDQNGNLQWSNILSGGDYVDYISATNGIVYAQLDSDSIYAVSVTDGSVLWSETSADGYGGIDTADGLVTYSYNSSEASVRTSGVASASVDIDGGNYSFVLERYDDKTESIDLSKGSYTANVETSGELDVSIDWTEDDRAYNPEIEIAETSDILSVNGALGDGQTETFAVDLSTGTQYDVSMTTEGSVEGSLEFTEQQTTEDPSIELDGGSDSLSYTGKLSSGQTVEEPINLTTGTHSATVSSNGRVQAEVVWDDVSITEDPEIVLNGNSVSYTGSIADGNSQTVTVDPSYLSSGTNSVTVNTVSATPNSDVQVKLTYGDNSAFFHSTYNNLGFVPSSATLSGLYEADQDVTVTFYIEDDAGNSVEIPSFDSETSLSALSSGNVRLVAEIDRTAFSQSFSFDNYSVFFTQ